MACEMTEYAPFDIVDYLDNDEMIVEYLRSALLDGREDKEYLRRVLSDIARSLGIE